MAEGQSLPISTRPKRFLAFFSTKARISSSRLPFASISFALLLTQAPRLEELQL